MKSTLSLRSCLSAVATLAFCVVLSAAESARERTSFNADWRFAKDDPADTGATLSYANAKPWHN